MEDWIAKIIIAILVIPLLIFSASKQLPSIFINFQLIFAVVRADASNFAIAFSYTILGLLIAFIDFRQKGNLKSIADRIRLGRNIYPYILLFVASNFLTLVLTFGEQTSFKVDGTTAAMSISNALFSVSIFIILIILFRSNFNKFQVALLMGGLIAYTYLTNSRGYLGLFTLLLASLIIFSGSDPIKWIKRILLSTLILIPALLMLALATVIRRYGVFDVSMIDDGLALLWLQINDIRGNFLNPGKITYFVEATSDGRTYLSETYILAFLYGQIPSFIWSGKPPVSIGQEVGEELFGSAIGRHGGGVPTDLVGQLVLTYGGIESAILGFVFLFVLAFFALRVLRHWPLFGLVTLTSMSALYGSDIGRISVEIVRTAILATTVIFLLRIIFRITVRFR